MTDKKIEKFWLSNADEIGAAIGRSRYQVPRLVRNEDLPAFKFYGRWTALPDEVKTWCRRQYVKHRSQLKKEKRQ